MGRVPPSVRSLLVAALIAAPAFASAQAGATKEEKNEEKVERTGAKTPSFQVKPDAVNKKPPVITFVTVPAQPYTGPILDFKNGPNGTPVPYDVRTGRFVTQEVRNTARWRRAPDGMIYDISTGQVVPKAVVDASAEAYKAKKAGAPDPVGEEKKLSFNTDAGLSEAERKARETELNKPKHNVEVWQAGATGKTGINLDAIGLKDGEIPLVPENAYLDLKLKVGQAEGTGAARVNVGTGGVDAEITLEGKVTLLGVAAETGKLQGGDRMLGGSVYGRLEAAVLAEAKAQGHLQVGPDGVLVGAEGGLFAGAKAKLEVPATVTVGGVETRATVVGEVSYGIGAEGKVYTKITWTSIRFRAQGHAALGVGVGGELDVEISVAELVKEIAPPETPTLDAIVATRNEVNPLATKWTLSQEEFKKMAAAVLAEPVNREKALAELKAFQDHFLGGLADRSAAREQLRSGRDYVEPFVRLRQELYEGNPDAVAGFQAALADAKASGLANDPRFGRGRLKELEEMVARNARGRVYFDSSKDFLIPQVNRYFDYNGERHVLPSYTGPQGMDPDQLLGVADWWVKLTEQKKAEVNAALAQVRDPDKQIDLLKKLAADEISARVDDGISLRARPDVGWIEDLAGPVGRDAAQFALKSYTAKQLNIMARVFQGGRDRGVLENEIQNMVFEGATGSRVVAQLWSRLAPPNTPWGQRARKEIMLEQVPSTFPTYLRWLKGQRDAEAGNAASEVMAKRVVAFLSQQSKEADAKADKVLAAAGLTPGSGAARYATTTVSGMGAGGDASADRAIGAGMRRD